MPTATVVVPEDQLSLAIGRNGQNARLAAKLSGWRIDIKGLFEAVSDTLFKIQDDPKYAQFQDLEAATIPRIEVIMAKKADGRPITPEEYRELHNFNSRVESGLIQERKAITKQQQARIQAAKAAVPDDAYDLPIMTLGLPTKVENLLNEADFTNVGELAYRLLLVPDMINDIEGIGPSYLKQIESALEVMIGYQPLPPEYDIVEDIVFEEDPPAGESEEDTSEGDESEDVDSESGADAGEEAVDEEVSEKDPVEEAEEGSEEEEATDEADDGDEEVIDAEPGEDDDPDNEDESGDESEETEEEEEEVSEDEDMDEE